MHFIGPDQLHGFRQRLTTDIYPSNFAWTPGWPNEPEYRPTGISLRPVVQAGKCVRSLQIGYDDEVEFHGVQKIHDLARYAQDDPFFLTISFTHPHSPFTTTAHYWDKYRHDDIDLPSVRAIPVEELDEHSRWLYYAHGTHLNTVTEEHVRTARHAYYGMCTYVDDKVGRIMEAMRATGGEPYWAYEVRADDDRRFVRNAGAAPTKAMARLLALGVPGDIVTAVILGAFMIHGLQPGPLLFQANLDLVYSLFIGIMVSSVFLFIVGKSAIRVFSRIVLLPNSILFPIVLVLCVYGGYAVNNNLFDILVMMLLGLLGFGMLRANIPAAPFLIAFVLGPLLEDDFRQSLLLSHGSLDIFVRNEIC